jgi:hypothetical protein
MSNSKQITTTKWRIEIRCVKCHHKFGLALLEHPPEKDEILAILEIDGNECACNKVRRKHGM